MKEQCPHENKMLKEAVDKALIMLPNKPRRWFCAYGGLNITDTKDKRLTSQYIAIKTEVKALLDSKRQSIANSTYRE